MIKESSRKVVMIGTSLSAPGGMTSVVRAYRDAGFFDEWNVVYLSAYERPGLLTQLRVMAGATVAFFRLLCGGGVQLLHVHSASRGSFWRKSVFCAMARTFQVPYIFHLHSGEFPVFAREECGPLARRWIRHTLRSAHSVVALTESWRDALTELAPSASVIVLGNPVVLPASLSERRAVPAHILFLGRLREKKGVFDLVRAVPAVLMKHPDARFTLAGDGDLEGVARQVLVLGVTGSVSMPGWVDGEAKEALLSSADVLVLPSYYEGLPVCILEAMAIGIPVVSTAVGGIPDVLDGGTCGTLVPPGDVKALSLALIEALSRSEAAERRRRRALARARDVYAVPVILAQLGDLYRNTIQSVEPA